MIEDADKLDPTFGGTLGGREVFANMCEKLYDIDAQQNIVPQLADALPTLSDGDRTVIIPLRKDIQFNDGTDFNAAAVKESLDRHRNAEGSARKGELEPVADVEIVDDHTVKLTLSAPYAPLTSILTDRSGMIMSPAALEQYGDDFALHPVCVGPFSFVERVAGDRIVLEKSKNYYDADAVQVDKVIMRPITDSAVRVANLRAGQLDIVDRLPATDFASLQGEDSLKVEKIPSLATDSLFLNIKSVVFKDVRVRQALELSLDKEQINETVYNGLNEVTCQPYSVTSPYFDKELSCPSEALDRAKALLREAGVTNPSFTLLVNNDTQNLQRGQLIQAQAGRAGFNVKVSPAPATTALSQLTGGDFDAYISAWSGRVDPDLNISRFIGKDGSQNYVGWGSPRIEDGLTRARATSDPDVRFETYQQVWQDAMELHEMIVLSNTNILLGWNTRVENLTVFPDGLIRLKNVTVRGPGN